MYCPNCGEKVSDGSRFCEFCGTGLEMASPAAEKPAAAPVAQPVTAPVETPVEAPAAKPAEPVVAVKTEKAAKKAGIDLPKVNPNMKKFGVIGAAAVAVVVLIVLLMSLSGGGSDSAYVYLSDGGYQLLTNLKKGESVEIDSVKADLENSNQHSYLVRFSPDGKYVYYYTKLDRNSNTASLNRAEFGKLKANSTKNSKYIEVIATNVQLGFSFFDDGTLVYSNGDNALYYYDGTAASSVAKKVNTHYIDRDGGRIIYTTGDDNDKGQTLYGVKVAELDNKIKLASNVSNVYYPSDFDSIFYTKESDDNIRSLYVVGFEKEAEKISADVRIMSVSGSSVYFTENEGKTVSLYDYVTDDKKTADAGITEPDRADYEVPEYSYNMIYGDDVAESNYTELYTSCTRALYWYGMSTWWSYSMEDAMETTWINNEGVHAATQAFIDKFADRADENGYILVTEDVKQALKEINKYAAEPGEYKWLWLCFFREQSGTTLDYDAYYAAYDIYEEAADRIWMREQLQNPDNAYAIRSLYCYNEGTKTLICDNMLDYWWVEGGFLYNTTDLITEKLKLEEVDGAYMVSELFYLDLEAQNYLLPLGTSKPYQMSENGAYTYSEAYKSSYANLILAEGSVFMSEENGALSVAKIADNVVGDFDIITDDGHFLSASDGKVYFINGVYESNDVTYGDLYAYAKGEKTMLARDIVISHYNSKMGYYVNNAAINLYEDDMILAYTSYGSYGYELTMINKKGESTIVADDVTMYVRVSDSQLLFISDNDLYSYNGKEKVKLQSDVEYLWCQDTMARTNLA